MKEETKCNHANYPAYWGNSGWVCYGCRKEIECPVKYTANDLKPRQDKDGMWLAPNPCCPACPHPPITS